MAGAAKAGGAHAATSARQQGDDHKTAASVCDLIDVAGLVGLPDMAVQMLRNLFQPVSGVGDLTGNRGATVAHEPHLARTVGVPVRVGGQFADDEVEIVQDSGVSDVLTELGAQDCGRGG